MRNQCQPLQRQERKVTSLCEECNLSSFKYKCPACSRRTCSLPCVKFHKNNSGCSGKRDPTHFVSLSQFDESTLLSDFNLLEDVKRAAESAQRMRVKLCGYPQFGVPYHLKELRAAANKRGTKLLFLAAGMSKRVTNKTRYDKREKSISWTIELRFHSTDVVLLEHGVHETTTLRSVIENHLQPGPWRNKLRRFSEESVDKLKFFIRTNPKGSKTPHRELNLDTPLRELFSDLVILEYPIIQAFLPSDSYGFKVVKKIRRRSLTQESKEHSTSNTQESKEPSRDYGLTPKIIFSKEEEIVEGERAPEPQIIDLHKISEANGHKSSSHGAHMDNTLSSNFSSRESTQNLSGNNSIRQASQRDKVLSSTHSKEVEILEAKAEDFDFDPDGFLDYEQDGEGAVHENTDIYFADMEDLEEGEIPNSD